MREHIKTINFFNTKAKNVIALSRAPRRGDRRRGAAIRSRCSRPCPASAARPRASCSTSRSGAADRRRHPHLPRREPPAARRHGKTPHEARRTARADRARAVPAPCPSLADPARALHLQGPPARNAGAARSPICAATGQDTGSGRRVPRPEIGHLARKPGRTLWRRSPGQNSFRLFRIRAAGTAPAPSRRRCPGSSRRCRRPVLRRRRSYRSNHWPDARPGGPRHQRSRPGLPKATAVERRKRSAIVTARMPLPRQAPALLASFDDRGPDADFAGARGSV